ncbi:helix-turn-helix transcriptional regulator [Pseudomonas moraviensis]|uniref:helix-turn-helix transcriptional regulator n=1 Tax=Pseudomonas moraviensis TaxID=321662 RepID=UPI0018D82CEF|nr:helix-turn-helix transcriptional regulator [Pseudomonas moraviensis]MBH3445441.1 helix-turn-helix transcriptional regulator [Pseudomonas moraviensis]
MSQEVLTTETNRRQLQQIIAGLSDGVILLELDKSILWANEAALTMHGVSTIGDLGSNADEYAKRFTLRYRNNHVLPPDNYPISRVARCEAFNDLLIEVSSVDDPERVWVHSVRSMVLTDRVGQPESLVLIMSDVTDWANAEQRFEKTFNANPAPAVICRLSDLRYIKVNPGFLEMTGYTRDQVIGTSAYEIDIFEQADQRDLAVQRLRDVATIPQMQAELRLPDGGSKQVIVAGQPLLLNDENCMLFSFVDMEPRRRVEVALRQSEERFAKAFRLTPVPILICTADKQEVIDVNQAFLDTLAYDSDDVLGKTVTQLSFIHDDSARTRLLSALAKNGRVDRVDVPVRKKDEELLECAVSADTVNIHDTSCYLLVLMDMTERKRTELELVAAIEEVMKDASWFSRTLIEKLANVKKINSPQLPSASFTDLTARERDVLGLICEGLADKEIAARLKLAPNTVRNHVATVYSKIDVHSRSEAIVWARERGLFSGEWGTKGQR